MFHVFCTDSGEYVLATRQIFATRASANSYADSCATSRKAVVIPRVAVIRAATEPRWPVISVREEDDKDLEEDL